MAAPRWIARANKVGLNRVTRFVAPWAPGWAVIIHRGRRSGRTFRTPLWAFRRGSDFVIALTYGRDSDWVRNVQAAGTFQIRSRRRLFEVTDPQIFRDDAASDMPAPIRFAFRRVVTAPEFLRAHVIRELPARG